MIAVPAIAQPKTKAQSRIEAELKKLKSTVERLDNVLKDKAFANTANLKRIIIDLKERDLTYVPSELHIDLNDPSAIVRTTVLWVSKKGKFTLTFAEDRCPFDECQATKGVFESEEDQGMHFFVATTPADKKGRYHYKVLLQVSDKKKYEDPDCPPIIIETPPPTPPQPPQPR